MSSTKPRVILGLMTFGPDPANARVTDLDQFKAVLDTLQKHGYNEVDTAHSYCGTKQQAFTREAGWKERNLKLATKYYPSADGPHSAQNIREKLEWNLKELGTDSVDIFYLHAADRNTPFAETLEECNKMYKEGKFKELGVSNYTAYEVAEVVTLCDAKGWVRPTVYQGMYNAITRNLETELIVACHRYGLQIVVYNPIAGGLFSGRIKSIEDIPDDSSRFGAKSHNGENYRQRYFRNTTFEALQMVSEIAEKKGLTMIEIALRWTVHHSKLNVGTAKDQKGDGIIIGVSKLEHLESNLKDLEKGPLDDDVIKVLDEAWDHVKAQSAPYWHGKLEYGYDQTKFYKQ